MNKYTQTLYTVLMLLFSCCVLVHAQRDFRPGYLVNLNNDTIKGYLLYKAVNTSSVCVFKTTLNDLQIDYTPADILEFRFDNGKYYITKEVPLEIGKKLVFVEFLIKGKANVYYMRDGADHYFIEKENGRMVELTESKKVFYDENGAEFVKPEQYSGKLKSVLSDCPEIYPVIDRTNLNHSSLIKLAKDYHYKVCKTEDCIVFERKKSPLRLHAGLYAGYTLNTIKFGGRLTTSHSANYPTTYGNQLVSNYVSGFLLGFRFEFENIFSSFEHASLLFDVAVQNYTKYHLTETGDYDLITYNGKEYILSRFPVSGRQTSLDVNINTWAIKVPLMLNYTFLKGKARPYVNAGFLNMFLISQNKDFNVDRFTAEYGKSIPTYHFGFTGAAGVKMVFKNKHYLFFDLSYEYSQSANVWPDLRFVCNQFGFKGGFSF
ncbi:MAG: hypothetical protein WCJ95_19670 [Mariniphaga sp.]